MSNPWKCAQNWEEQTQIQVLFPSPESYVKLKPTRTSIENQNSTILTWNGENWGTILRRFYWKIGWKLLQVFNAVKNFQLSFPLTLSCALPWSDTYSVWVILSQEGALNSKFSWNLWILRKKSRTWDCSKRQENPKQDQDQNAQVNSSKGHGSNPWRGWFSRSQPSCLSPPSFGSW